MSASELAVVEELLLKVLPDPMGFAERVIGELAGRLAADPGAAATVVPGFESDVHEALVDRSLLLAAALGACPECWGDVAGCADCGGEGSPGWAPPDPVLYAEYIAPAVRRAPLTKHTDGGETR